MQSRLIGLFCAALLGALVCFYGNQIWLSSECANNPKYYGCPKRPTESAHQISAPERADDRIAQYTLWLAILTGGLVIVSSVQISFLIKADKTAVKAANAAQTAAEHIPNVERGYIIGGGPIIRRDQAGILVDPPNIGWLSIGNYGKTSAILKKIEWGFGDEIFFPRGKPVSELLDEGRIPRNLIRIIEKEDVLRPGQGPYNVTDGKFNTIEQDGKVFFGRFTYFILFDDRVHFSTFKLKMKDGGSFGLPGSYSDWK